MKMMRSTVFIQRTFCKYKNRGLFLRNYTKSTKSQQFDQIYTTFDGMSPSYRSFTFVIIFLHRETYIAQDPHEKCIES